MNFTGGTTLPNIGRRINWQLVMVAGGLAVAIAAGAMAGVFERGSSPATTAVTRPQTGVPPAVPASGESAELIYVLVGSQGEATILRSMLSTEASEWPQVADQLMRTNIVALETAADEAEFFLEVVALRTGLRFVDLRTPATGLTQVELANFFAEAVPAVESRSVSDADLTAGVLSSELANFAP
jgi:hypothetical protein